MTSDQYKVQFAQNLHSAVVAQLINDLASLAVERDNLRTALDTAINMNTTFKEEIEKLKARVTDLGAPDRSGPIST